MMKRVHTLSSKLLATLMALAMLAGMIPFSAMMAGAADVSLGTIESLVSGGTVEGNTVVFSGSALEWSPMDNSIGRWSDGWWVGVKVTAPADVDMEKASYQNKSSSDWGEAKSFKQYRDSDDGSETQFITLWGILNEGFIVDALFNGKEYLSYEYRFDWNGDGTYEQPVTIRVNPKDITLMKDGVAVYPKDTGLAQADVITTGLSVSGNAGNMMRVENTETVELTWHPKDDSIGRPVDGWWVGYYVVAPAGVNAEKASYQRKASAGWDTTNTLYFKDNKDAENRIPMWCLINEQYLNSAVANNKTVKYSNRYDWDGDGVYEQIVSLVINPGKVVLKAENGEQVYPYLGTVTPLTGGSVSGNTANLELKIEETTLNWSEANPENGRNVDGWWVGMNVIAPEGYTADQLRNTTYKRRVTSSGGTAWSDYSESLKFWENKDSKDDDSTHYIGMWMVINPALIRSYINNGTDIKTEYVFDWDGNGTDDQIITMTVVPSDKIVLTKVEQTGFGFEDATPVDQWVGETYTNTAEGGKGTGEITYAITAGSDLADIDAKTGTLTFKGVGIIEVTATKAADDTYAEATATYTVMAIKKPQPDFRFENSHETITKEFAEGTYQNVALGGIEGDVVYTILSEESDVATIDASGVVTFLKAGTVTVVASKVGNDAYYDAEISYTLVIEKSQQQPLAFAETVSSNVTYMKDTAQTLPEIIGGSGTGKVTYEIISGNEYAVIENEEIGAFITQKAGGSFTIQVSKAGDDGYYAAEPITVTITVDHAEQTTFGFENPTPGEITFDDYGNVFPNAAIGGESTSETVIYELADEDSESIAAIDNEGNLYINAAGTITVVAKKLGDDCYKDAIAYYELVVKRNNPEFSVDDVNLIYGALEHQIVVNTQVGGDGAYHYAIVGENTIGASVDVDTGLITFSNSEDKVGSITVAVTKDQDTRYNELTKTFTLTVSYPEITEQPTISGSTINKSGWYTGDVTFTAPEGYQISYNNKLIGTVWSDSVTYSEEGENDVSVYLKKGDVISDAIIQHVKIDKGNPTGVSISYDSPLIEVFLEAITFGVYDRETTLVVTLTATDGTSGIDYFTYNLGGEDIVVPNEKIIKNENGVAEYSFTISADFRNKIKMSATDVAGRKTDAADSTHTLVLDDTAPKYVVEYSTANKEVEEENKNIRYYDGVNHKAVVTFKITEANFDLAQEKGQLPTILVNDAAVTDVSWVQEGDQWIASYTCENEGEYVIKMTYTDLSGNEMTAFVSDKIVVDGTAPSDLKIEYSQAVANKILETITFGFYDAPVDVTVTAKDNTAGVDYFVVTYPGEDGTVISEKIQAVRDGVVATATFEVPANARGYVTAVAYDFAGNNTFKTHEDDTTIVVDTTAPEITVSYEAGSKTKVQYVSGTKTVDTFAGAKTLYYNGNVTAKIEINDANFFEGVVETIDSETMATQVIHQVAIKLVKTTNDGVKTTYEYLPAGANQFYSNAVRKNIVWKTEGDKHSIEIAYNEDADYVLSIEYVDISGNEAKITETIGVKNDVVSATKSLTSKVITVDKIAPVVSVKYSNEDVIHTLDGRKYFDAKQTATITVKEHNFRAADFNAVVEALNVVGDEVKVENFNKTLSTASKWTSKGDTHTITIKYPVSANYTFDYTYQDLAQNAAKSYKGDVFTVDTTAPKNLTVTYSDTSVWEGILEAITFGYYNSEVTVTISAEDDVSGIYYFVYSYVKSEGVSDVNVELLNEAVKQASGKIKQDGKKFTMSFTVPKKFVPQNTQFNGTVEFTAYDRAENSKKLVDDERLVVDDIAPTIDVTYSADPDNTANNINYYAGAFEATIVINEANFYGDSVVVKVNDQVQSVQWVDDSVDVHTGVVRFAEDGDYILSVEYTDRSGNKMDDYTSPQMTLDTKAPTVSVSNVKNHSANKDEKYGFTITVQDINMDKSSFNPQLNAILRNEDGKYVLTNISLGSIKTTKEGEQYYYTVDNLPDDGVYTLTSTLQDLAGNVCSELILSDGKSYDQVRFSINRNGSTFAVDEYTGNLVEQYYVYSVTDDVVIEEINVDPVEDYTVRLNGEELEEGTDYTTTQSNKAGEWSKRTYVISKKLFESEGEYSLIVESVDKTNTTAYSDVKNLNVSFVVDQTSPVITISGLETDGRYQVTEQTVTVIPTDDGGRLNSMKVVVLGADGAPLKDASGKDISVRFDMSGEAFLTYLTENDGKVSFTVPEGLENQVEIYCNDCTLGAEGKANEEKLSYTNVTVSQSGWIIFYANKPLFYGSIAGVVLLFGGVILLIVMKNRKKEADK